MEEVIRKNLSGQTAEGFASASSMIIFDGLHVIWGSSSPCVPWHRLMQIFHPLKLQVLLCFLSPVLFPEQIWGSKSSIKQWRNQCISHGADGEQHIAQEQRALDEEASQLWCVLSLLSLFNYLESYSFHGAWKLFLQQPQYCFWAQFTFLIKGDVK